MMRKLEKLDFEGRTIVSADIDCSNVIHLTFSDGEKLSIWAEIYNGIPCLETEENFSSDELETLFENEGSLYSP